MVRSQRQKLHQRIEALVGVGVKVHFLPTVNTQLAYPCVVYEIDRIDNEHADNKPYSRDTRYQLTVMDTNVDSVIVDKIATLPKCSFSRTFRSGNIVHTVFNLYE